MLYEKMKSKHEKIERELESFEAEIRSLPEGRLTCKRDGGYCKWYALKNGTRTYISKKDKVYLDKLARKEYLICSCEDLKNEKEALELYLKKKINYQSKIDKLIEKKPEFVDLLSSYFEPMEEKLAAWMNAQYETNNMHPENLTHRTSSGRFVRSKTESIIATILEKNHIPYRYECKLELGEYTIYPDFTIMHPKTGDIYYWEHLGMLDEYKYLKSSIWKLELYASNEIYPSFNLLTTYETRNNQFDAERAENMVKYYFCN